jgi:hypothetical protein
MRSGHPARGGPNANTRPSGLEIAISDGLSLLTSPSRLSELSEPNNRPRVRDMSDGEWLTYTEAARRLGTTPDAIRQRVKREQMRGSRGNDGRPRVWADAGPVGQLTERNSDKSPNSPNRTESEQSGQIKALEDHIETLKAQLLEMRQERERDRADHAAELARVETRLIEERTHLQEELQEARADADHAKADQVRMAQDVAGMFNELRVLTDRHADHATELERVRDQLDRARQDAGLWREEADRERALIANLQADAEHTERDIERDMTRLRTELEQARRPWWRRLIGR